MNIKVFERQKEENIKAFYEILNFKFYFIFLGVLSTWMSVPGAQGRQRRTLDPLGAGVIHGCESLCTC